MALRTWWAVVVAVVIGGGLAPRAARAVESGQGSTPLADDRTLVALAVALACADAPQAEPPAPGGPALGAPANDGPELELVATVHAKALKFDVVPKTQVVFQGSGRRKTTWKTERVNLPMNPQPGVTYRDVAVRLTVTSDIQELAALLREAKKAAAGIQMEQQVDPPAAPAAPAAGASAKPTSGAATVPSTTALPAAVAPSPAAARPAASPIPAAPAAPAAPAVPPAPTVAPAVAPAAPAPQAR
jgi:hypothetical protein